MTNKLSEETLKINMDGKGKPTVQDMINTSKQLKAQGMSAEQVKDLSIINLIIYTFI